MLVRPIARMLHFIALPIRQGEPGERPAEPDGAAPAYPAKRGYALVGNQRDLFYLSLGQPQEKGLVRLETGVSFFFSLCQSNQGIRLVSGKNPTLLHNFSLGQPQETAG
jgi:hypothetical protein